MNNILVVSLWIGAAVILLGVVAILTVAWLGSRLPVEHVARGEIEVDARLDALWDRIDRVEQGPSWRAGLRSVTVEREVPTRIFTEHVGRQGIRFEETERRPPDGSGRARLVRKIADPALPFGGEWVFELEAIEEAPGAHPSVGSTGGAPTGKAEGRSRLVLTEHGSVPHPIFRYIAARFIGHDVTLRAYLGYLSASFASRKTR